MVADYTTRDIMIMRLIADDWTYREIARELGVSRWTIRARVALICHRLQADDRKQAADIIVAQSASILGIDLKPHPTERQMACLRLAMAGLANKEIGRELGITPQTVKNHLSELYEMIGANDRCHAVALLVADGVIKIDEVRSSVHSYYDEGRTRQRKGALMMKEAC